MNKLKFLLSILMAVLIAFVSQRAYHEKNKLLSSIYSDIIFTQITVEAQEYTQQIEYGLKNGKNIENFYNVDSILSDVSRCFSYTKGVYVFSADYLLLYELSEGGEPVEKISASDFSDGAVYLAYNDSVNSRYLLTLPIFGRNDAVNGYMVLDISDSAVDNKLSDFRSEYLIQSAITGVLCWFAGVIAMIHCCRSPKRVLSAGVVVTAATVFCQAALDGGLCVFKLSAAIDRLVQQSASRITMSLQNTLDAISEKGAALSKVYDLNSWLMENAESIPFISGFTYDRNYRITADISDGFIFQRVWSFAGTILLVLALCAGFGLLFCAAAYFMERTKEWRTKTNEKNSERSIEQAEQQPQEECLFNSHA